MSVKLAHIQKLPTVKFVVLLALVAFFIKIPFGILGAVLIEALELTNPLFHASLQEPTLELSDVLLAVVIAPAIETLLGQVLPIQLVHRFTRSQFIQLFVSAGFFMILHYPVIEFFPSAFAVGWIFAWAWIVKRDMSKIEAFWIVSLIHSLHNAIVAFSAALLI